ncbi:MAG: alpha/beta fold hydrolase [Albidovulum sp.]|nr:alpha/beta fold hydrolase [Albidovulum sp.]MDE0308188.1 alpha/beta fold hydrolase [Albidovulum sp.]
MAMSSNQLEYKPGEDPFVVARGGFYRRWLSMIDDLDELIEIVSRVESTTEDKWVPAWREAGRRHENDGDALATRKEHDEARKKFLLAKTFYAIGRFPGEISPVKASISSDCARAYRKACEHLDPPMEVLDIRCGEQFFRAHFRAPPAECPVPAILVMCGADVFKEDRGWVSEHALDAGMASLVMDAPGTGENPFPWEPGSVKAWVAGVEALMARPEVDSDRIGAFGISRGGYSVMQLAGTVPEKIRAVVAIAGHPFGYRMKDDEMEAVLNARNRRARFRFGPPDGPPSFSRWSADLENEQFDSWALSSLGLVEKITMPVLMINGDEDHLAPIGNIYFMLESGPIGSRTARVYRGAGHCAFEHQKEWAPESFRWLAERLA